MGCVHVCSVCISLLVINRSEVNNSLENGHIYKKEEARMANYM